MLDVWILISAWATLAGWLLSCFGALDRAGYTAALLLGLVGLVAWFPARASGRRLRRPRASRFRRLLPRLWLALSVLIFAGGLVHAPSNYDYLTYRFPRVLHWQWRGAWHWVETLNERMNYSATGAEWLMTPLFVFLRTDRVFFLLDFASYLLLPGLVFSVFRRLGVGGKMAWSWMWLLPAGYCYALQAGSVGNDAFAAVYLLASLRYALAARDTGALRPLVLSCLSAALMTGTKASNLPLLLPCAVALVGGARACLARARRAGSLPRFVLALGAALLVGALASFAPNAVLNRAHTGDAFGDPANLGQLKIRDPMSGLVGNALQVVVGNLTPPVFPLAGWWNRHAPGWVPEGLAGRLRAGYPRMRLTAGELPTEEAAGLGFGLCVLLGATGAAAVARRPRRPRASARVAGVLAGGGVALLVYMVQVGSESAARILTPYYPLLVAGVLVFAARRGDVGVSRAWRALAVLAMLSVFPAVVLTPARPLVPVPALLGSLASAGFETPLLDRIRRVYEVYARRSDGLAPVRAAFPEGERRVGLVQGGDDPEATLWRPFGAREVISVLPSAGLVALQERQIRYVAVSDTALRAAGHGLDESMQRWRARLVAEVPLTLVVQRGAERWYVLEIPAASR